MSKLLASVALIATLAATTAYNTAHAEGEKSARQQCGERWSAHKTEHGKPEKGQGQSAWAEFQKAQCHDLWKKNIGKDNPTQKKAAALDLGDEDMLERGRKGGFGR